MSFWVPKREDYYIRTGSMFENPFGVPEDEIIRMILDNPPEVVAQTVFGKYVESSGLVFTGELVQMLFDRKLPRVLGESWVAEGAREEARAWYRHSQWWGQRYHTGIDFARQTDYTVIFTIDTRVLPARVVYFKRLNRVSWESIYAEVGRARQWFGPNILCDSTGPGGDAAMDALEGRVYCSKHHRALVVGQRCLDKDHQPRDCRTKDYLSLSCVEGFHFTGTTKKDLVDHLRVVLSAEQEPRNPDKPFGWLRCPPIPQLEEELAFYTWDDKKLSTDCLFALALAAYSGLEDQIHEIVEGSPWGT